MARAREIAKRLNAIATKQPVFTRAETRGLTAAEWSAVHWVKPTLICEIAFTEWTDDGSIRHPSFQGMREDKSPREVKKEIPVKTEGLMSGGNAALS